MLKQLWLKKRITKNALNEGNAMVMREVKKGKNVGNKFWGCSKFPKCRGVINVTGIKGISIT